jgi:hypothetical protein
MAEPPEKNEKQIGENTRRYLAKLIHELRSKSPEGASQPNPPSPLPKSPQVAPQLPGSSVAQPVHPVSQAVPPAFQQQPAAPFSQSMPPKPAQTASQSPPTPPLFAGRLSIHPPQPPSTEKGPELAVSKPKGKIELTEKEKAMLKAFRKLT